ncbi:MAG TPA: hypothetical protein EYH34_11685 [Planctomycetes bacterium]|nr:hypothetical protein [Planctomycetota bacterium]
MSMSLTSRLVWAVTAAIGMTAWLTTPLAGGQESPAAEAAARHAAVRSALRQMLGIPANRCPLRPEPRGQIEHDEVVIEKWVWTIEPGSRTPALIYRPKHPPEKMPAIVLTYGHGGSKSSWQYHYAGLLYARLGLVCAAIDPIGEEERNRQGRMGTRAHDARWASDRADAAGRLIMGKLVFDTMRTIDYLLTRNDIAFERIGVAGNSLGGAVASYVAAVEPRIRLAIVSGWAYDDITLDTKLCTRLPNERMRRLCDWPTFAALAAPGCALWIANGDADVIIDRRGDGQAWRGTRRAVREASQVYAALGGAGKIEAWFEPGGGHRPYFAYKVSLEWIHEHLGAPDWPLERIRDLPAVNAGQWCDRYGIQLERLYGTPLHWRGATLPDLGIRPLSPRRLAVLHPDEIGRPEYTLEGWLDLIESHGTGHGTHADDRSLRTAATGHGHPLHAQHVSRQSLVGDASQAEVAVGFDPRRAPSGE